MRRFLVALALAGALLAVTITTVGADSWPSCC
jgi:hypothetical protein